MKHNYAQKNGPYLSNRRFKRRCFFFYIFVVLCTGLLLLKSVFIFLLSKFCTLFCQKWTFCYPTTFIESLISHKRFIFEESYISYGKRQKSCTLIVIKVKCLYLTSPIFNSSAKSNRTFYLRGGSSTCYNLTSFFVKLVCHEMYPDYGQSFGKPPWVVKMKIGGDEIVVIVVHLSATKPRAANELDALDKVRKWASERMSTTDIVILGDFNTGNSFMSEEDFLGTTLRTNEEYHWVIKDYWPTTTKILNLNSYDKIVVYGNSLKSKVSEPNGSGVDREVMNVAEGGRLQSKSASTHYPVWAKFNFSCPK